VISQGGKILTVNKKISNKNQAKNNGKNGQSGAAAKQKLTVKYTITRTQEDIKRFQELKKYLQGEYYYKNYNTDSEIYRDLPVLFFELLDKVGKKNQIINKYERQIEELETLRNNIEEILEFFNIKPGYNKKKNGGGHP